MKIIILLSYALILFFLSLDFMTFKMRGGTGPLRVEAKVTSYRKDVLEKEGIENYVRTFCIINFLIFFVILIMKATSFKT